MARKKNTVRSDGRISVQVYLGRDEEGKRKYKTVYGHTQAEADKKAQQVKLQLQKGIDVAAEYDTFQEWYDRWIAIKACEVSDSQISVYKGAIKHLGSVIMNTPITKIKTVDIQSVILSLAKLNPNTGKPASKRLLLVIKQAVGQVCQLAIDNRVMDYNPAKAVKIPDTKSQQKRRALTPTEQQWINEFEHRAQTAAMIMMYAGLRRGELIPLTWSDINLENATITVNKSVEKVKNYQFKLKDTTKTEAGMRIIDIPQRLVNYLKDVPKQSIFVCVNQQGKMHTPSSWDRMWDTYLLDLNLKYGDFGDFSNHPKSKFDPNGVPFVIDRITPHWLRHTFATILYFSGVDILTAKEQLGHANIKTTLEIYTHLDKQFKRKSMDKVDAYLDGASLMQVN